MKRLVAAAAAAASLLGVPAIAQAAEPPPGSAMSSNLEYLARVPDAAGITEGKFDRVRGSDVMVITGRFGFKTYDVSDPADPQPLDTYLPPELAANGYWQNEDMELDTRRKLIIGALDPRHTELDTIGLRRRRRRAAGRVQERLLRHLLRRPGEPAPGRGLRRAAVGAHLELHPGLPLHLDGRSGPAGRSGDCAGHAPRAQVARADPRPDRARPELRVQPRRRQRPADLGHRPAQSQPAGGLGSADRPVAQRRLHGLLP